MLDVVVTLLRTLISAFRGRSDLVLKNVALRHQLMVIRRHARRPKLTAADRSVWIALRWLCRDWPTGLIIVKPATVIAWHRGGDGFAQASAT